MKTTKTILLLMIFSIMVFSRVQAQNPGFEWAGQMGGDSAIMANSIATDADGNQIITGTFNGTADFDPGAGVFNLTSSGKEDIFIQKLSSAGTLVWAASMGDVNTDMGRDVVTDASGNIYVTGYFSGTIDADPGAGYFELSQTKNTAFVLKIEPDGDLIWAKQMGFPGDWGLANGYAITLDNNLNVITTGTFYGRVDFDPGSGTFNLSATSGSGDVYIQKLDANGNFIWAKQLIGPEYKVGYSLESDANGDIYSCGFFKGTVDFNPDKKLKYNLTSYGDYDAFILKLSGSGNFTWAKQIGGSSQDLSYDLVRDPSGNILITGYFFQTADFNPGSGTYAMTSFGGNDAYILKLDPAGSFVWAKQLGGPSNDAGYGIESDIAGNVYVTGFCRATADFDPGTGTSYLTSNGLNDGFVFKADSDGNLLWVSQTGGPGVDYGARLALDGAGNIYTVGKFEETVDFNPTGNGILELTNSGFPDLFVQKLNPSGGGNCPVPTGLLAANMTEISADLGWNEVLGAGGYFVRYREILTDWIEVADIVIGTSLPISGLASATAYEFQVKTDCFSNYSYSVEFLTTGGGCIDNYEPNATLATAATIPVNTDIAALIGTNGDYDWFKFSTTVAAKNIKITLTDLPADYDVRLYKADGTMIGSSLNTGTAPETIIYNYNKAGTYYVLVNGYGVYDPINCYTLRAAVSSTAYKSADAEIITSELTKGLTVYPNPSNAAFNFRLSTDSRELVQIQVYDLSGRLVREYNSLSPNEIITLGEDLKTGMYVAFVTQGNDRKMVKLSKVR
jgi:hypothetical protein